jgi:hypothetical protein
MKRANKSRNTKQTNTKQHQTSNQNKTNLSLQLCVLVLQNGMRFAEIRQIALFDLFDVSVSASFFSMLFCFSSPPKAAARACCSSLAVGSRPQLLCSAIWTFLPAADWLLPAWTSNRSIPTPASAASPLFHQRSDANRRIFCFCQKKNQKVQHHKLLFLGREQTLFDEFVGVRYFAVSRFQLRNFLLQTAFHLPHKKNKIKFFLTIFFFFLFYLFVFLCQIRHFQL